MSTERDTMIKIETMSNIEELRVIALDLENSHRSNLAFIRGMDYMPREQMSRTIEAVKAGEWKSMLRIVRAFVDNRRKHCPEIVDEIQMLVDTLDAFSPKVASESCSTEDSK